MEELIELEYEEIIKEYKNMLKDYPILDGIVCFDEDAAWDKATDLAEGRRISMAEEMWEIERDR